MQQTCSSPHLSRTGWLNQFRNRQMCFKAFIQCPRHPSSTLGSIESGWPTRRISALSGALMKIAPRVRTAVAFRSFAILHSDLQYTRHLWALYFNFFSVLCLVTARHSMKHLGCFRRVHDKSPQSPTASFHAAQPFTLLFAGFFLTDHADPVRLEFYCSPDFCLGPTVHTQKIRSN